MLFQWSVYETWATCHTFYTSEYVSQGRLIFESQFFCIGSRHIPYTAKKNIVNISTVIAQEKRKL